MSGALDALAAWGVTPDEAAALVERAAAAPQPRRDTYQARPARPPATVGSAPPAQRRARSNALFPTPTSAMAAWKRAAGPGAVIVPGWRKALAKLWESATSADDRDRDILRRIRETEQWAKVAADGFARALAAWGRGSGWYVREEGGVGYVPARPEQARAFEVERVKAELSRAEDAWGEASKQCREWLIYLQRQGKTSEQIERDSTMRDRDQAAASAKELRDAWRAELKALGVAP